MPASDGSPRPFNTEPGLDTARCSTSSTAFWLSVSIRACLTSSMNRSTFSLVSCTAFAPRETLLIAEIAAAPVRKVRRDTELRTCRFIEHLLLLLSNRRAIGFRGQAFRDAPSSATLRVVAVPPSRRYHLNPDDLDRELRMFEEHRRTSDESGSVHPRGFRRR